MFNICKSPNKFTKTVGERAEIDEITNIALITQEIFGQQVLNPNWTWKRFFLHNLLPIVVAIYVFCGTLETLQNESDTQLVAEASYTLIMTGMFPIKLILFISNRYIFRELYLTVKINLIKDIKENCNSEIVFGKARKVVYLLFAMVTIPVSNYETITLWNYVNGRKVLLSRTTDSLMPMVTPYHEIAWLLHSIYLLVLSTTIILDMWFVLLIYFLCSATESLVMTLKVKGKEEDESLISYQKRLNESLRSFYYGHVIQTEFLSKLTQMYKWLAFVPLSNAAMCICIILLLLSKDVNWRFAPHVLPMFAEIFAYNWFGEQIKSKTREIEIALLNFDWTSSKTKDRMSYCILMTYMNKEIGIKTALGHDLSLITMTSVLRASYQAFTVLQSTGN